LVFVPGGTFQMGSTETEIEDAIYLCNQHYSPCNRWYYMRENPQHPVTLDSFWFDQTEVTNAQYRRCVENGMCSAPLECKKGQPTYLIAEQSDHPVVCINWDEAQAYCHWVGGRLPTEAEWEYAFRGENGFIFPWGNEFDGHNLNYCDENCDQLHADERFDDAHAQTAPVAGFPEDVSWSGVFDLGGNVSEWVADWFGDFSSDWLSNPLGPAQGSDKMVKGCSWFFNPAYCRGAARPSVDPNTRFDYLGFRCAVSLED
jgi:formylglycine-generating enzyme required for sulfatase activity